MRVVGAEYLEGWDRQHMLLPLTLELEEARRTAYNIAIMSAYNLSRAQHVCCDGGELRLWAVPFCRSRP
jgi:hypothetical protein